MKINAESLRGYILEEVLAYLIRNTGYKLLVAKSQDPHSLEERGNGLVVKGRGANHQADVLGELQWIPAFTFPIRLFVEAKFRNGKTGIGSVRNAVGVVLDINQNNFPSRESGEIFQKFHYAFALFSTSGFSPQAMSMALAHQISLIDLSGLEFQSLLESIAETSDKVVERAGQLFAAHNENRSYFLKSLRNKLRMRFGTYSIEPAYNALEIHDNAINEALTGVINTAEEYNELFVAMANGPFMLLLKASNRDSFLRYARKYPRHQISIHWSSSIENGNLWTIQPKIHHNDSYQLTFRLPEKISEYIFGTSKNLARQRALNIKNEIFSSITYPFGHPIVPAVMDFLSYAS